LPVNLKNSLSNYAWSSDSKFIGFTCFNVGKNQLYVMDWRDKKPIYIGNGTLIHWCPKNPKNKVQATTQPDWLTKKEAAMAQHDQIQAENEKQAASYERPAVNQALINTVTDVHAERGVFAVASDETNLPFASVIQAQYKFTTKAFMANDFLISGAKSSDPTCGFIIDIKTNPKTMQDTLITYDFSDQGAITFNNMKDNNLYFKNANGDAGQLDIASNKYTGVLPTKKY
jgi:hypothetical protein